MIIRPPPRTRKKPHDLPPLPISWRTPKLLIALVLVLVGAAIALIVPSQARGVGVLVAAVGLWQFGSWWLVASNFIDARLQAMFSPTRIQAWPVHTKYFPLYKFVDLHHAAQMYAREHGAVELRSAHPFDLDDILAGIRGGGRRLQTPQMIPRKIGHEQETFVPSDTFWVAHAVEKTFFIVRVSLHSRQRVRFEVAAPHSQDATQSMDAIIALAASQSIYRNRTLRVVFGPEVRNAYGDDESNEPIDLAFVRDETIAEANIVLDAPTQQIIERTIIDFHQRRADLTALGLPGKRGVLFYGPPGTGKTYTCKYIGQRLTTATKIVATGHALLHMKAVCAIAKMLQPALVLLEDVDLVFSQRELNAYNTVLGEFIDQLDGFGETDQIIFIMTTNAIERIEAAIKDRPGRVSQCIFFGAPSAPLRRRYLATLVQPYCAPALSLDRVVGQTDGVSQAFLKELVFRSVQVATANGQQASAPVLLTNAHFDTALNEMTTGSGRAAKRIIGFRVEAESDASFG